MNRARINVLCLNCDEFADNRGSCCGLESEKAITVRSRSFGSGGGCDNYSPLTNRPGQFDAETGEPASGMDAAALPCNTPDAGDAPDATERAADRGYDKTEGGSVLDMSTLATAPPRPGTFDNDPCNRIFPNQ